MRIVAPRIFSAGVNNGANSIFYLFISFPAVTIATADKGSFLGWWQLFNLSNLVVQPKKIEEKIESINQWISQLISYTGSTGRGSTRLLFFFFLHIISSVVRCQVVLTKRLFCQKLNFLNLSLWVLWQFEFCCCWSFVTIWIECFVPIWVFDFCCYLIFVTI